MNVWRPLFARSRFGDLAIVAFLVSQAADGVFTYIGVQTMGMGVEGNPLIIALMAVVGEAPALAGAKVVAATLGVLLHLSGVHRVVALLTALYLAGAVMPWAGILFFRGQGLF